MIKKALLILFLLFNLQLLTFGQKFFKLSGSLRNYEENFITFSLYKNWVEDPIDYTVKVDKLGKYQFEIPLDEIAYCDVNYGPKGLYTWIIEPSDEIELNADFTDFEKSMQILGKGSSKWVYLNKHKNKYEDEQDWDLEYKKYNKVSKKGFLEVTQFMYNEQIALLNKYKDLVSSEFYSLQRADLYGKVSNVELEYLIAHKLFTQKEFERFQLKTFNPKIQNKSFYYGIFVDNLIANNNLLAKRFSDSKILEYESIKAYFDKYDYVPKAMIDRILANKLINYIDLDGYNEENKMLVESFKNISKNKIYTNAVVQKFNNLQDIQPGKIAKNFILPNEKGDLVALKDYRGKNIFLSFYASWCGPCINDLKYLDIINSYFKLKNDFAFISISIDDPTEFKNFLKTNKILGVNLNAFENHELNANYSLESVPKYFLIDKSGAIVSEKLLDPSDDEGRAMIKQIERLIYQK